MPRLACTPLLWERHDESWRRRKWNSPQALQIGCGGEIGLDLTAKTRSLRQQYLLDAQLSLAKRYDLPVILIRDTHDKLALHLKRHNLPRTGWFGFPVACNRQNGLCS